MAGADIARIDLIIVEILFGKRAILITDQAVFADQRGIELDLDLHVLGDREQCCRHFLVEHLLCFERGIDIGIITVPDISDVFHHRFVVVALPEAKRRESDAAFAVLLDYGFDPFVGRDADVEIAVGRHDHAIDAAGNEVRARGCISQFHALPARRRTAGLQAVERRLYVVCVAGGFENDPGRAGIDNDRHLVARGQFVGEHCKRGLDERQLVRFIHRSGNVDKENKVRRRALLARNVEPLDADAE